MGLADEPFPANAPALCLVCTPPATGSQPVATLTVPLSATIADVRAALCNIAGADGSAKPPPFGDALPMNVDAATAKKIAEVPLQAFDFSAPFVFVRHSTSIVPPEKEGKLNVAKCLAPYPERAERLCTSSSSASRARQIWAPVIPTVRLRKGARTRGVTHALCVLFVSLAEPDEECGGLRLAPQPVLLERLSLSLHSSSFGDIFVADAAWTGRLNKWNLNTRDYMGYTLLHECVMSREEVAFSHLLVQPQLDVGVTDFGGNTALHLAVQFSGHTFFVERLLTAGANPLRENAVGNTPLHLAFLHRRPAAQGLLCARVREMVRDGIIEREAVLAKKNMEGISISDLFRRSVSFVEIVQHGSWEGLHAVLTHFLFEPDSLMNELRAWNQSSALHLAVLGDNLGMIKYILSGNHTELRYPPADSRGQTPLHIAAAKGNLEIIASLAESIPASLAAIDVAGDTPLLAAVKAQQDAAVIALVRNYDANSVLPHWRDACGFTALQLLCGSARFRLADALLTRFGMPPAATDGSAVSRCSGHPWKGSANHRYNTFVVAAEMGNWKYPSLTTSKRCRENAARAELRGGRTPTLLLRENAGQETIFYTTALAALQRPLRDSSEFLVKLAQRGAVQTWQDTTNFFAYMISRRHTDLSLEALGRPDKLGLTGPLIEEMRQRSALLFFLCQLGDSFGIRWCIEARAGCLNPAVDDSPLHRCVAAGDAAAVRFLLERGADANFVSTCRGGLPPLAVALHSPHPQQDAVIKALVQGGAALTYNSDEAGETWNALVEAALCENEVAVAGLLGFAGGRAADAALPAVLRRLAIAGRQHNCSSRAALERICVRLTEVLDTSSTAIHPYELLCMAARERFWGVADRLARHLQDQHRQLDQSAAVLPPPPPARDLVAIERRPAPARTNGAPRVSYVPQRKSAAPSFRRATPIKGIPSLVHSTGELPHRLARRDAFSYAAEEGQQELLESLFELGISPWDGGDRARGWGPADYALAGRHVGALRVLLLHGVAPLCEHRECTEKLKTTSQGPLLRACARMSRSTPPAAAAVGATGLLLVALLEEEARDDILLGALSDLLQHRPAEASNDVLAAEVAEQCVRHRRLTVLQRLVEETKISVAGAAAALHWAALLDLGEFARLLVTHGCSPYTAAPLPKDLVAQTPQRLLSKHWDTYTPLFMAACCGKLASLEVMLSGRPRGRNGALSPLTPEECMNEGREGRDAMAALGVFIRRHGYCPYVEDQAVQAVRLLHRAGHPYLSATLVESASSKRLFALMATVLECYGAQALLLETDLLAMEPQRARNGLLHGAACSAVVCAALKAVLEDLGEEKCRHQLMSVAAQMNGMSREDGLEEAPRHKSLVDVALENNVPGAALLFLSLGFEASGRRLLLPRGMRTRCYEIAAAQHLHRIRVNMLSKEKLGASYSMLHSATELGYTDLLAAFIQAHKAIHVPLPTRSAEAAQQHEEDIWEILPCKSLFALALRHAPSIRDGLLFELLQNLPLNSLAPSDVFYFIAAGMGVLPALHSILQRDPVLLHRAVNGYAEGLHHLRYPHPPCDPETFLQVADACLEGSGPLGVAVGVSSLEWVQYLLGTPGAAEYRTEIVKVCCPYWASTDPTRRRVRAVSREKHNVFLWAVAVVADAYRKRHEMRLKTAEAILLALLKSRYRTSVTSSEYNVIAIALAAMCRWDSLHTLMSEAQPVVELTRSAQPSESLWCFSPVELADIPEMLRDAVGPYRHVLQAVAYTDTRGEHVSAVAAHCRPEDLEVLSDARGRHILLLSALSLLDPWHRTKRKEPSTFPALKALEALRLPLHSACCDRTKRTLLHVAAWTGHKRLLKKLLKYFHREGHDVDAEDANGLTALMLAARNGHIKAVELLLAAKADPLRRDARGFTAAMHAATAGHDQVATALISKYETNSGDGEATHQKATLLHCVAFGGCSQACELTLKRSQYPFRLLYVADSSGDTPLGLARCFGRSAITRQFIAVQAAAMVQVGPLRDEAVGLLERASPADRGVLHSSPFLPRYGWLSAALVLGAALQEQASATCGQVLVPEEPGRSGGHLHHRWARSCSLKWCIENRYTMGIHALGNLNVLDECFGLHYAALLGAKDVVQLLLSLKMSSPARHGTMLEIRNTGRGWHRRRDEDAPQPVPGEPLLPFEVAAVAGHEDCALLLLDALCDSELEELLRRECTMQGRRDSIFHRIAIACHGTVLQALVKRLSALKNVSNAFRVVYALLQREDVSGMTVLERIIAMGDPEAFLRCVEMQRDLEDPSQPAAVMVSPGLLHYLPSLAPSLRVLLFDVLDMVDASRTVGFEPSSKQRGRQATGGKRLVFGDVRLIGLEVLRRSKYCTACTALVFTPQHERTVLRYTLRKNKQEIRFEPRTFEQLPLGDQSRYLQWLGSSIVLSAYKKVPKKIAERIELTVGNNRETPTIHFHSAHRTLTHSVCCSNDGRLLVPNPVDAHPTFYTASRKKWEAQLVAQRRNFQDQLRQVSHPAFEKACIDVEWNLLDAPQRGTSVDEDAVHWEGVLRRLWASMDKVCQWLAFQVPTAVNEIPTEALVSAAPPFKLLYRYTLDASEEAEDTICFSDAGAPQEDRFLSAWLRRVSHEAMLVRVSRLRDAFLKSLVTTLHRDHGGVTFNLLMDGTELVNLPIQSFQATLDSIREGVEELLSSSVVGKHSVIVRKHVRSRVRKNLTSVVVTIASNEPITRASYDTETGSLLLWVTSHTFPSRSDVEIALTNATVLLFLRRSEQQLPTSIHEGSVQLRSCLPGVRLEVNLRLLQPELVSRRANQPPWMWDKLLSIFHQLFHKDGKRLLDPLLQALQECEGAGLGATLRKRVRRVLLQFGDAPLRLTYVRDEETLVYSLSAEARENKTTGAELADMKRLNADGHESSLCRQLVYTHLLGC
eukprot:gene5274-3780_t